MRAKPERADRVPPDRPAVTQAGAQRCAPNRRRRRSHDSGGGTPPPPGGFTRGGATASASSSDGKPTWGRGRNLACTCSARLMPLRAEEGPTPSHDRPGISRATSRKGPAGVDPARRSATSFERSGPASVTAGDHCASTRRRDKSSPLPTAVPAPRAPWTQPLSAPTSGTRRG